MELREIIAPTMKELFIKELEKKIISGEWAIGERLPTEREMERKMKVSRTIINSGLAELARNGFVEIVPRKGVFVGDYIRNGQLATLMAIMNFNGGKLDKKTFDSLMNYRLHNDCECAHLAALNRTNEDLDRMKDIHARIVIAQDMDEVLQLKNEFHNTLYFATGNNIYPLISNAFRTLAWTFNEIIYRNFGYQIASLYMAELINALEMQNPEEARSIMGSLVTIRIEELKNVFYKE